MTDAPETNEEWQVEPGLRVIGICGSLRVNSATKKGLATALASAADYRILSQYRRDSMFCVVKANKTVN